MNYNEFGEVSVDGEKKVSKRVDEHKEELHDLIGDTKKQLLDFENIYEFKFDIGDIVTDVRDNAENLDADYKSLLLQNLGSRLEIASINGEDVWFDAIKKELIAFYEKPSTDEYAIDELFEKVKECIPEEELEAA